MLTRNHQGIINAIEKFEGRKFNYEPLNAVENGYVYKLTPDAIEMHSPAGVADARCAGCRTSSARCARAASR